MASDEQVVHIAFSDYRDEDFAMKIGFIGLGIMGSPMALNLLRAGHHLAVHNRTRDKAQPVLDAGATWAATPAEAARGAEMVVTMLSAPDAVRAMALGPEGLLAGLELGALWMDCSTVNPSFSREMAVAARERGVRCLDAPVAGTRGPAEKGELAFYVGGEPDDVAACEPLFDAMGRAMSHVGPAGMGSAMKMVLNLLLAQAMQSFSEALVLGQSLGITREMLLESLIGGRMTAPYLVTKKERLEQERFEPADFPLRWMHKDLQLVTQTAFEHDVVLPTTAAAKETYGMAKRQGLGALDFSAIYRFLAGRGEG